MMIEGSVCVRSGVGLFLALTILTLSLMFVSGAVYSGPRFGKREQNSEMVGRVLQRTSGVRSLQARSAGERRFYAGTRYGGKRSFLPPIPPQLTINEALGNEGGGGAPYDCIYVPFNGIRCSNFKEDAGEEGGGTGQISDSLKVDNNESEQ